MSLFSRRDRLADARHFAVGPFPFGLSLVDVACVVVAAFATALLLPPTQGVLAALWAVAVAVVIRSDLRAFVIPDAASALIASLGLAELCLSALDGNAGSSDWASTTLEAFVRSAVPFGFFWLIGKGFSLRTGRDGLGFGDVKLAGASGLWLPLDRQVVALELACLAALFAVFLRRRTTPPAAVPFGAFLAPAAWLIFVLGPALGSEWPF